MFGYVTVHKPELKIKDFDKYNGYYCGLCRSLKEQYGSMGQMTLTYDMTFAIILLTSLYESETAREKHRCVVHPIRKKDMLRNEITEYAAAMNVILAYYHFQDDWEDERSVRGLVCAAAMKKRVKSIESAYPRQCKVIKSKLEELSQYEKQGEENIDVVAGCFGTLMSELFVYQEDYWEEMLRTIGFYLGKFVYIMDAFDDVEKDMKKQSYNPLIALYRECIDDKEAFDNQCHEMLQMMIAECSIEFEKLPCLLDIDILRNILYDGVWTKYNLKKYKNARREEDE